jgi:hypothetical protein
LDISLRSISDNHGMKNQYKEDLHYLVKEKVQTPFGMTISEKCFRSGKIYERILPISNKGKDMENDHDMK